MQFLRQLAGETVIYGLGHILPRLLQYILFTPILTRILTKDDYGALGLYYLFIGLLLILFTFRLETAFFRFGSQAENREKFFSSALGFIFIISAVFIALFYLFRNQIAGQISIAEHGRFVIYSIIIIALDAIAAIPFARLRLEQKSKAFAWLKILNVILIISITLFLLFGLGILEKWAINIPPSWLAYDKFMDYIFIGNIAGSFCVAIILFAKYFSIKFSIDRKSIKQMLRYSLPLVPVGIAGIINSTGDQWFIKEFMQGTPQENLANSGVYAAAKKIAIIMSLFTTAFNYAVEPFFFRNSEKKEAKTMYARTAEAYGIVGCLIMLGIIFYLDIFQYLLGSDFREGIFIVPIALLAFYFLGLYYNFSAWYKLTDNTGYGMYIAIIGACITIALNIILLPRIGYVGSSIAAVTCFFTMSILCIYFGRKHYLIPYNFKKIGFYFFITMALIGWSVWSTDYFNFALPVKLTMNTILLLLFMFLVYAKEKNGILARQ